MGSERDKADAGNEPMTYTMAFTARAGPRLCPVEGYIGQVLTRMKMRVHF